MSTLSYPAIGAYKLPRKNVLVISCIDLRLTDNLLAFLHHDNLTNRYDHFILAGASLCTTIEQHQAKFKATVLEKYNSFTPWQTALADHLQLAIDLHDIRDVYIVEHQDCGAYTNFLKDGNFEDTQQEEDCHRQFAQTLAEKIHGKIYTERKIDEAGKIKEKPYQLNVHSFLIDLRGNVKLIHTLSVAAKADD